MAGVKINENKECLPEYFVYRFLMPPNTLFDNIYQLPPGHDLIIKKMRDENVSG